MVRNVSLNWGCSLYWKNPQWTHLSLRTSSSFLAIIDFHCVMMEGVHTRIVLWFWSCQMRALKCTWNWRNRLNIPEVNPTFRANSLSWVSWFLRKIWREIIASVCTLLQNSSRVQTTLTNSLLSSTNSESSFLTNARRNHHLVFGVFLSDLSFQLFLCYLKLGLQLQRKCASTNGVWIWCRW